MSMTCSAFFSGILAFFASSEAVILSPPVVVLAPPPLSDEPVKTTNAEPIIARKKTNTPTQIANKERLIFQCLTNHFNIVIPLYFIFFKQ